MDTKIQKYILLNDRVGESLDKGWFSSKTIPTQLLRGEIFDALPESEQPEDPDKIALRSKSTSKNANLVCPKVDVSKLTDSETDLLVAVSSTEERFRFHQEKNLLSWVKSLSCGSLVLVDLKNKDKAIDLISIQGVIRYKGPLPTCDGTMFGVELLSKEGEGLATTDGTFRNKRYFQCPPGFGVFVSVAKLRPQQNTPNAREASLEVGTMVEVPKKQGKGTQYGVIRWIGQLPELPEKIVAGLELESEQASCSDGMFGGKRYFECPKGRAFFVNLQHCRLDTRFQVITPQQSLELHREFKNLQNDTTDYETGRRLSISEQRAHDLELQLHTSEQRSHELELALGTERHAREETERRLRSSEQRSHDLELQLHTSEQRSHELELALGTERHAREETETRFRSLEQRSRELEASLATERQAHEETVRRLRTNAQRLEELETSLAEETQANQETERRLRSSEERSHEIETTLNTVRQAYEACRRSLESTRDWVLLRDEIRLSDKVIGIGAWGEVKEGTFRGCKVAVKKIHHLILSAHNRRLFEREMNMASRFRHPCLLQFIGATNDDQSPLFVTELLDTSLRAVLHDRPLEPPEITTIALDVAKGLNYLHLNHPAPIIHRDISSANVLLWKHVNIWRAKVSDYGTANFLQQSMTVAPGAVIYSAPEAQTSRQSPKLDVYSFGVLLCEMIVGEMPDVEQRNEQIAMVTNNFFRNLIRRCLMEGPEERPSIAEIIEELENSPQ